MKTLKVVTVVGTRPELIRLSRVLAVLESSKAIEHMLIHTGQNYDYELNEIFFSDLGIKKPDVRLEVAGKSASETIGQLIAKIDPVLEKVSPDAMLVLGDTNSCLAAIPAKRRKIPVFHMEAGNRCFDQRVPEEINRKIVDHISDINMTYSTIAREYLLGEGIPPDRVIKTGSPMYEVLAYYSSRIHKSTILKKLMLKKENYYVVSCHREENIDSEKQFFKFVDLLNSLAKETGKRVIVSTHPRTRKKIELKNISIPKQIELMKPMCFSDYVKLQLNAIAVLSDSGTITEESSILNFPALNIRDTHERPEGMEEAAVIMTGLESERVFQGLEILKHQKRSLHRTLNMVSDYNVQNVSEKVLRVILSYTNYINRVVWSKDLI